MLSHNIDNHIYMCRKINQNEKKMKDQNPYKNYNLPTKTTGAFAVVRRKKNVRQRSKVFNKVEKISYLVSTPLQK